MQGASRPRLGLHLNNLGDDALEVRAALRRPLIAELGHGRRRGDGVDGDDLRQPVGRAGDRFAAVEVSRGEMEVSGEVVAIPGDCVMKHCLVGGDRPTRDEGHPIAESAKRTFDSGGPYELLRTCQQQTTKGMDMEFLFVLGPGSPDDFLFSPTVFVYPSQTPDLPLVTNVEPSTKETARRLIDGYCPANVAKSGEVDACVVFDLP